MTRAAICALALFGIVVAPALSRAEPVQPAPAEAAPVAPADPAGSEPPPAAPVAAPQTAPAPAPVYPAYNPPQYPTYAPAGPEQGAAGGPRPIRKQGDYRHDGFCLRLGVGAGLLQTSSSFEGNVGSLSADEAIGQIGYSGSGVALDLLIGGSPLPGFVLAYGFAGQLAHEPTVSMENTPSGDHEQTAENALGLSVHGVAVDIFPDPEGNLELGGLVGLGAIGTGPEDANSLGWAAALWGGYGFWANKDISLVALLRLAYARTQDEYVPVTSVGSAGGQPASIDRVDDTLTASLLAAFLLN